MIWYIGLGSALGGMTRYALAGWAQQLTDGTFPVGTLVVNVAGSFALGFLLPYTIDQAGISPSVRAMLTIGFCGGFTTFSTFSYEALARMQDGQWARAGSYMAGSVVLSLAAVFAGWIIAHQLLIYGRQA